MVPWSANCAPIMTSWMPPRSQSVFDVSCATVRCVQHAMCLRKTKKGAGAGKNRDAVAVHVASPAHRHPSRIPGGSARDAEAIGAIDGGEEERIREGARGVVDAVNDVCLWVCVHTLRLSIKTSHSAQRTTHSAEPATRHCTQHIANHTQTLHIALCLSWHFTSPSSLVPANHAPTMRSSIPSELISPTPCDAPA